MTRELGQHAIDALRFGRCSFGAPLGEQRAQQLRGITVAQARRYRTNSERPGAESI